MTPGEKACKEEEGLQRPRKRGFSSFSVQNLGPGFCHEIRFQISSPFEGMETREGLCFLIRRYVFPDVGILLFFRRGHFLPAFFPRRRLLTTLVVVYTHYCCFSFAAADKTITETRMRHQKQDDKEEGFFAFSPTSLLFPCSSFSCRHFFCFSFVLREVKVCPPPIPFPPPANDPH